MVASPESRYGKAGLYAIFATQSNDFALGYPIGEADAKHHGICLILALYAISVSY